MCCTPISRSNEPLWAKSVNYATTSTGGDNLGATSGWYVGDQRSIGEYRRWELLEGAHIQQLLPQRKSAGQS